MTGVLVHTGQHYDEGMSDVFFRDLGIPVPDVHLGVGSGSPRRTDGPRSWSSSRKSAWRRSPDWCSSSATSIPRWRARSSPRSFCIPVAHVEAGLRSFDRTMPEEINRLVTDALRDPAVHDQPRRGRKPEARRRRRLEDPLRRQRHDRHAAQAARESRRASDREAEAVRARDAAPSVERRRSEGARPNSRSASADFKIDAGALPDPSSHAQTRSAISASRWTAFARWSRSAISNS